MSSYDSPVSPRPPDHEPTPEPASTRRRQNWGFTLTYVLLLGAVVGGGVYAVVVAGDDSADPPEQTVRDYLSSQADHDCEAAVDLLSERMVEDEGGRQELIDDCADDENEAGDLPSDEDLATMLDSVETEDVDGDRATVTYQVPADVGGELDPVTLEFTLVKESGAWKIDNLVPVPGDLADDSPQAAARDQAQAVIDQDCERFLGVLTEAATAEMGGTREEQLDQCEQWFSDLPEEEVTLGPIFRESEDGDTVEVGITVMSETFEGGNNVFYVTVVREDGGWKVDQAEWSDAPGEET